MREIPYHDPRLPGRTLEPLAGGWSGETFLAAPTAGGERFVVRYFAAARHASHAAGVQAALLRRVHDLLPVPAVRQAHDAEGALPGLLVTELLPGERGDMVLARLVASGRGDAGRGDSGQGDSGRSDLGRGDAGRGEDQADGRGHERRREDLRTLGRALGHVAGTLAAVPMPGAGLFADATLRVEPFRLWLPDWVDAHAPALAGIGWSGGEVGALRAVADRAAHALDGAAPCLVHSDLNPKNVLVDPVTLRVTGVLDWEFAHAGHPSTDLGNLLRFDREPAYVEGVLDGWYEGRDGTAHPGERARRRAVDLARAADLVALVELAARPEANAVVRGARAHLRAIARTGDVRAVP